MLRIIKEDAGILGRFFLDHILYYINKIVIRFKKKHNERKFKDKSIVEIILEFEGVKKIGGEFMGKRYVSKIPVHFYRLKRNNDGQSGNYFYVGYIERVMKDGNPNTYQVVLEEDWDTFILSIERAIKTNEKVIIGIRKREGGIPNGRFRSSTGRKVL